MQACRLDGAYSCYSHKPDPVLAACTRFCRDEAFPRRYRVLRPGIRVCSLHKSRTEAFAGDPQEETTAYVERIGFAPRVILLENHGIITLGRSPDAVKAAMFMAEKAAKIFVGAAALGGPQFLSEENISRILGRPDEHYRGKMLRL